MSPDFEHYKIFYYAAKYRNFTLAAKVLLTSQPSITRSIKALESELGCRLFVRSRRGVNLTPEGKLLYGYIASACDFIFKGEEALSDALSLQNGSVYIGATETAIHCFLLEKLEAFRDRFPRVGIKIIDNSTPHVIGDLIAGKIDLAVVTTPIEEEKYLGIKKVRAFENILIAGPGFADLKDRELGLADLKQYPFVCLSEETMSNRFFSDFYAEYGFRLEPDIELATADLLLPIIGGNLGIGFIPFGMAEDALKRGDVFKLHLKEEIPDRYICVVKDRRHPLSAAARQMAKLLVDGQQDGEGLYGSAFPPKAREYRHPQ